MRSPRNPSRRATRHEQGAGHRHRQRAVGEKQLQDENLYLRQELAGKYTFANIIGKGSRMQEIFRTIERIGKVSSTVLLNFQQTREELTRRDFHLGAMVLNKTLPP